MLNKVWFGLLVIGIVYGLAKGTYKSLTAPTPPAASEAQADGPAPSSDPAKPASEVDEADRVRPIIDAGKLLNNAVIDAAKTSVEICIGLIGFMALWLGMLQIASDAGLVAAFARMLRPLMRVLFPEIPNDHPAQGAILMNLSANMLGLDNAATPLGLKAMTELQKLNPVKDTATDSMAMFLAINTSSITLVPFTIIGYRALNGSHDPAAPIAGTFVATIASTIVAIFITRWFSRWKRFQVEPEPAVTANAALPNGGEA